MKLLLWIVTVLAVMVLSACSMLIPPDATEVPYPGVEEFQIQPTGQNQSEMPYPQYANGDSVPATVVIALLQMGAVERINISESREAILFLKDGRSFKTNEPFENAFHNWIEQCGDPCKNIEVNEP